MKKWFILFALAIGLNSLHSTADQPPAPKTTIKVPLVEKMATESQWVYLFQRWERQTRLLDSVFVPAKAKVLVLDASNQNPECSLEIVFGKSDPTVINLYPIKNGFETVVRYYDYVAQDVEGPGAGDNMRYYARVKEERLRYIAFQDSLSRLLAGGVAAVQAQQFKEAFTTERSKRSVQGLLEDLHRSQSACLAWVSFGVLQQFYDYTPAQLKPLMDSLKVRFPNYPFIQLYPDTPRLAPPTPESKVSATRRWAIINARTGQAPQKKRPEVAVPTNFLLDKDRRIVAVNLRGLDLLQKIEELTQTTQGKTEK